MFRENVLVKAEIIGRVSGTMVPVALDYQLVLDPRSREARFLRPLMRKAKVGGGGGGDKQGLWIFSPDGRALGHLSGFGDMVGKTHRLMDNALELHGPVSPRRVPAGGANPQRGRGFRPDGSVLLAEYVRRRDRDKIKSPVISSVALPARDFAAFAPERAELGHTWDVPGPVAKRLCRAASPMCYQHAPQPSWVKEANLGARVTKFSDGVAEIAYQGTIRSERVIRGGEILSEQALALEGEGRFDIAAGKMIELRIVGAGVFRWPNEAPDKRVPFDALIEWEAAAGGD